MAKTSQVMLLLLGFGLIAGRAHAAPTIFIGEDVQPSANPTVRTNADAAAASFRTAALGIGSIGTINFESAPLGAFTNLTVAPGVTISGTDGNGSAQTIRNTSNFPAFPSVDGYNTTTGGTQFVEMIGGTLTFTFQNPTQFFGVYLSGVQTNFFHDFITFNDGTTQTISLTGTGTSQLNGETAFLGFVDAGAGITSITINAGTPAAGFDAIGVDDVSYQTRVTTAAPEPSSLALLLPVAGIAGMLLRRRGAPAA